MKGDLDWKPLALVPVLALLTLPFIGSASTWVTLTVAGLAMGMIIFIIASGLTLVFGLMDVLNFGHGVFIALGAFVATSVLGAMGDYTGSASLWMNLLAVLPAMNAAVEGSALKLAEAADAGDMPRAASYMSDIMTGCVACHQKFRGTPGISANLISPLLK